MSISASTNKEGNHSLYINPEFCVSTDLINFKELVMRATDTEVTCYGILSAECRGVSSYKDKQWKPDGKKVTYRVFSKEKEQWDKDTSKYVKVGVHKDEALLYKALSNVAEVSEELVLTGSIAPWINPFIYELDANESANVAMIEKMMSQITSLTAKPEPYELTQAEIAIALEVTSYTSKKGVYTKPETELERLQSRYTFFEAQLKDVFEFTSLYDLAVQIEAIKANEESISPALKIENSVNLTLELLKTIMGAK